MAKKMTLWLLGVFLLTAGNVWAEDIVVVVNANAPVQSLTVNQVRDIYLGESRRWGGTRITPVDHRSNPDLQHRFLGTVLHMDESAYDNFWLRRSFREGINRPKGMDSTQAALRAVAANQGGIGFFFASDASGAHGVREVLRIN